MTDIEIKQSKWWGRRWLLFMQELGLTADTSNLAQRMTGARVRQLEVAPGSVEATVHLRDRGDCRVSIKLPLLDDAQWEAVLDALAGQAIYSAQLLAGDMPTDIDRVFAKAGAELLPTDVALLSHTCDCCPPDEKLCKPLLAVYAAIGDMLNDDPWLLFRLRGRERQQVLRGLSTRRSRLSSAGSEQVTAEPSAMLHRSGDAGAAPSGAPDLAAEINDFWGSARAQMTFAHHIVRPVVDSALLRQLGPLPFDTRVNAFDALTAVYCRVSEAGLALAFAPEPEDDGGEGDAVD